MDKAKVSVANIYSGTLEDSAQYPGRFITFADTPDQPQKSTWLKQGQGVKPQSTSNSADTTINLDYAGGIKSITLSASGTP